MPASAAARLRSLIVSAIDAGIFPAAVAEVGGIGGALWRGAFGHLTFDEASAAVAPDTIFDLASLTKPIATTSLALDLAARGALKLEEPIAGAFADWRGDDRLGVTVQDLLEHAGGLPPRLFDAPPATRREFEFEICRMPLEYAPRSKSVYTDLGFILLGFLLADRGGEPLEAQFARLMARLDAVTADAEIAAVLQFGVAPGDRPRTAPTRPLPEDPRRPRLLVGEVHDNYAAALGGAAGHAGLFGNAAGVARVARTCLRALAGDSRAGSPFLPDQVARAVRKSAVPGSSRALGWDTMLPSSSCGTRMSPSAFGHVGHTGVSLWIDPARGRYFTLLTNRVCDGGTSEEMQAVRREFHDIAADM